MLRKLPVISFFMVIFHCVVCQRLEKEISVNMQISSWNLRLVSFQLHAQCLSRGGGYSIPSFPFSFKIQYRNTVSWWLTHWGRVTHICVSKLTIIASDNGLSPGQRQATIWTNAGMLLIWPWWTNFSEILIRIQTFSFKKMHLKMSSAKWRPFCLGLNVITHTYIWQVSPQLSCGDTCHMWVWFIWFNEYLYKGRYVHNWEINECKHSTPHPSPLSVIVSLLTHLSPTHSLTHPRPQGHLTHSHHNKMADHCRQHFQKHFLK